MLYPGRDDWKKHPEIRAAFRVIAEAGDVAALTGKGCLNRKVSGDVRRPRKAKCRGSMDGEERPKRTPAVNYAMWGCGERGFDW